MKKHIFVAVSALLLGVTIGEFDGFRRLAALTERSGTAHEFINRTSTVGLCADVLSSIDRNDIDGARGILQQRLGASMYAVSNLAKADRGQTRFAQDALNGLERGRDYVAGHPPLATIDGIGSGQILIEEADSVLARYGEHTLPR